MNQSMTIALDLAKEVFEVAVGNANGRILERARLSRTQFLRFFHNRAPGAVVMEACGSAHHVARTLKGLGFSPTLLPPQYVRPYRRRNKTDAADCEALLQAVRNPEIRPVPVKTIEQQSIQAPHRVRAQWMRTRTARLNAIRGIYRELGVALPVGAAAGSRRAAERLEQLPTALQALIASLLDEVRALERRCEAIEAELARFASDNVDIAQLREVPGIGLLTATALWAAVGEASVFRSGRHLAAWLGLTPREFSTGSDKRLSAQSSPSSSQENRNMKTRTLPMTTFASVSFISNS